MATETLRPSGNGGLYECETNVGAGSTNNYTYVDESSANDADYVWNSDGDGVWETDLYAFPDTAIPAGSTISKITFYARFDSVAGYDYCKFAYKTGGTTYYSSAPNVTTSFAQYSWEQTTNQKTGLAWTIDDINGLVAGPSCYFAKGYDNGYCSQFWLVIDYTTTGWTHITKVNGIASANIAKVNGIAVANIAKINGVAV